MIEGNKERGSLVQFISFFSLSVSFILSYENRQVMGSSSCIAVNIVQLTSSIISSTSSGLNSSSKFVITWRSSAAVM